MNYIVTPGEVYFDPSRNMFYWAVLINGRSYYSPGHHKTERKAKSVMLKKVKALQARPLHCIQ